MRDFGGICRFCKYWKEGIDHPQGLQTCEAFPEGIPDPIFTGKQMHFEPIRGDRGIVFAPDEDVTPEMIQDYIGFSQGTAPEGLRQ
ncbi:MAG: hypothetical protein CL489_03340 [Acidobacteria bacterium]|nr:hypothetical protein [Acidobacteriota bacterium]|tara:strand:- start:295 stop:552 length:258 start_codon:yes stop_codon:yes gene_type:complete